jgi:hypothetical protein
MEECLIHIDLFNAIVAEMNPKSIDEPIGLRCSQCHQSVKPTREGFKHVVTNQQCPD